MASRFDYVLGSIFFWILGIECARMLLGAIGRQRWLQAIAFALFIIAAASIFSHCVQEALSS